MKTSKNTKKRTTENTQMKSIGKILLGVLGIIVLIWAFPHIAKKFQSSDLVEIGKVPEFSLTNQNNQTITQGNYEGKVYVVEFFFSTCPTICPIMNKNMVKIDKLFSTNPNFGIVSITINPATDTPEVLKEHKKYLGSNNPNWNFLTGDREYIYNLSKKGFNLYAGESKEGGFEHSGLFALVDKQGNIRCRKDANGNPIRYYNGLEQEGVDQIVTDIKKLLAE